MDENKSLADANNGLKKPVDNSQPAVNANKQESNQSAVKNETQQTVKSEVKVQTATSYERKDDKPQVKKRRFHLYHIKNAVKKAHPSNIKAKLEHYRFEYSRILHLARKPTKQEFKELSIMVIVGTSIIGVLGFLIQMIIQFL